MAVIFSIMESLFWIKTDLRTWVHKFRLLQKIRAHNPMQYHVSHLREMPWAVSKGAKLTKIPLLLIMACLTQQADIMDTTIQVSCG